MVAVKSPDSCSDREELMKKLLNSLVSQLEDQQSQILLLANRIKLQHNQRLYEANMFQEKISEMARVFATQEMERMVDAAKSDLLMGLKERDALIYKLNLEDTKSELADFIEWFHLLANKSSSSKGKEKESELATLKAENSALLSEKNFAWNQFKKVESDLTDQLKNKIEKLECAHETMNHLLTNVEELQLLITEKDDTITSLKTNMAKLESESLKKTEEISSLSKELELLKKSKNDSATPSSLRRCLVAVKKGSISDTSKRELGLLAKSRSNSATGMSIVAFKKDSSQNSKRKAGELAILETPKLFSSTFKVPKLKSPSPSVI